MSAACRPSPPPAADPDDPVMLCAKQGVKRAFAASGGRLPKVPRAHHADAHVAPACANARLRQLRSDADDSVPLNFSLPQGVPDSRPRPKADACAKRPASALPAVPSEDVAAPARSTPLNSRPASEPEPCVQPQLRSFEKESVALAKPPLPQPNANVVSKVADPGKPPPPRFSSSLATSNVPLSGTNPSTNTKTSPLHLDSNSPQLRAPRDALASKAHVSSSNFATANAVTDQAPRANANSAQITSKSAPAQRPKSQTNQSPPTQTSSVKQTVSSPSPSTILTTASEQSPAKASAISSKPAAVKTIPVKTMPPSSPGSTITAAATSHAATKAVKADPPHPTKSSALPVSRAPNNVHGNAKVTSPHSKTEKELLCTQADPAPNNSLQQQKIMKSPQPSAHSPTLLHVRTGRSPAKPDKSMDTSTHTQAKDTGVQRVLRPDTKEPISKSPINNAILRQDKPVKPQSLPQKQEPMLVVQKPMPAPTNVSTASKASLATGSKNGSIKKEGVNVKISTSSVKMTSSSQNAINIQKEPRPIQKTATLKPSAKMPATSPGMPVQTKNMPTKGNGGVQAPATSGSAKMVSVKPQASSRIVVGSVSKPVVASITSPSVSKVHAVKTTSTPAQKQAPPQSAPRSTIAKVSVPRTVHQAPKAPPTAASKVTVESSPVPSKITIKQPSGAALSIRASSTPATPASKPATMTPSKPTNRTNSIGSTPVATVQHSKAAAAPCRSPTATPSQPGPSVLQQKASPTTSAKQMVQAVPKRPPHPTRNAALLATACPQSRPVRDVNDVRREPVSLAKTSLSQGTQAAPASAKDTSGVSNDTFLSSCATSHSQGNQASSAVTPAHSTVLSTPVRPTPSSSSTSIQNSANRLSCSGGGAVTTGGRSETLGQTKFVTNQTPSKTVPFPQNGTPSAGSKGYLSRSNLSVAEIEERLKEPLKPAPWIVKPSIQSAGKIGARIARTLSGSLRLDDDQAQEVGVSTSSATVPRRIQLGTDGRSGSPASTNQNSVVRSLASTFAGMNQQKVMKSSPLPAPTSTFDSKTNSANAQSPVHIGASPPMQSSQTAGVVGSRAPQAASRVSRPLAAVRTAAPASKSIISSGKPKTNDASTQPARAMMRPAQTQKEVVRSAVTTINQTRITGPTRVVTNSSNYVSGSKAAAPATGNITSRSTKPQLQRPGSVARPATIRRVITCKPGCKQCAANLANAKARQSAQTSQKGASSGIVTSRVSQGMAGRIPANQLRVQSTGQSRAGMVPRASVGIVSGRQNTTPAKTSNVVVASSGKRASSSPSVVKSQFSNVIVSNKNATASARPSSHGTAAARQVATGRVSSTTPVIGSSGRAISKPVSVPPGSSRPVAHSTSVPNTKTAQRTVQVKTENQLVGQKVGMSTNKHSSKVSNPPKYVAGAESGNLVKGISNAVKVETKVSGSQLVKVEATLAGPNCKTEPQLIPPCKQAVGIGSTTLPAVNRQCSKSSIPIKSSSNNTLVSGSSQVVPGPRGAEGKIVVSRKSVPNLGGASVPTRAQIVSNNVQSKSTQVKMVAGNRPATAPVKNKLQGTPIQAAPTPGGSLRVPITTPSKGKPATTQFMRPQTASGPLIAKRVANPARPIQSSSPQSAPVRNGSTQAARPGIVTVTKSQSTMPPSLNAAAPKGTPTVSPEIMQAAIAAAASVKPTPPLQPRRPFVSVHGSSVGHVVPRPAAVSEVLVQKVARASTPSKQKTANRANPEPTRKPAKSKKVAESEFEPATIPEGMTFADGEHVTMWNRKEKRKIAGNAAPLGKNLAKYLAKNPDLVVYQDQDKHDNRNGPKRQRIDPKEASAGEHIPIWNTKEKRKIAGNAAPLAKNLEQYLAKRPDCVVYSGQDLELKKKQQAQKLAKVEQVCEDAGSSCDDGSVVVEEEMEINYESNDFDTWGYLNQVLDEEHSGIEQEFLDIDSFAYLYGDENANEDEDVSGVKLIGPSLVDDTLQLKDLEAEDMSQEDIEHFIALDDEKISGCPSEFFERSLPPLSGNFEVANSTC